MNVADDGGPDCRHDATTMLVKIMFSGLFCFSCLFFSLTLESKMDTKCLGGKLTEKQ